MGITQFGDKLVPFDPRAPIWAAVVVFSKLSLLAWLSCASDPFKCLLGLIPPPNVNYQSMLALWNIWVMNSPGVHNGQAYN